MRRNRRNCRLRLVLADRARGRGDSGRSLLQFARPETVPEVSGPGIKNRPNSGLTFEAYVRFAAPPVPRGRLSTRSIQRSVSFRPETADATIGAEGSHSDRVLPRIKFVRNDTSQRLLVDLSHGPGAPRPDVRLVESVAKRAARN